MAQVEKRIFCVSVDDSKCSKTALEFADLLAKQNDIIKIIHVQCDTSNTASVENRYSKYIKQNPNKYKFILLKKDSNRNIKQQICHYVNNKNNNIAYLVTGIHGETYEQKHANLIDSPQHRKSILGSFSDASLRQAKCTSVIVPRKTNLPQKNDGMVFVLGIDGSNNCYNAYNEAIKLLKSNDTLHLVHVTAANSSSIQLNSQFRSENVINKFEEVIKDKNNIKIHQINGQNVAKTLTKFCDDNNATCLFVGADGMTAHIEKKSFIGSVSDNCIKYSKCAVIVSQMNQL